MPIRFATALTVCFLLGACNAMLTSDEPPRRTYWLEPVQIPGAAATNVALRVELTPGLGSDRINVLQPDRRLNHYAGAFWVDRLEHIVPSLLQRSLNPATATPPVPEIRVDVLVERLFALEAQDPTRPATVELLARVSAAGAFESTTVVRFSRVADSNSLADIVEAFQQVMDHLALEIHRTASP